MSHVYVVSFPSVGQQTKPLHFRRDQNDVVEDSEVSCRVS